MQITPLNSVRAHLGEGPLWDEQEQAFYWVDSLGPTIYRHDWASGNVQSWDLPGTSVGSLCLRKNGGLILAMADGFYTFDPESGECALLHAPMSGMADVDFNDGKVDREGRFVAGGVHGNAGSGVEPQPLCSMYRLEHDLSITTLLADFACFNGPCFSADGNDLYVTGRGDMGYIEKIDYKALDSGKEISEIIARDIDPDGATVDADGSLWSAQWANGCVLHLSPTGDIISKVEVPGQVVSSAMIGGPNMDLMFITTLGKPHWGTTPSAADAGAVFVIEGLTCKGIPELRFAG